MITLWIYKKIFEISKEVVLRMDTHWGACDSTCLSHEIE